MVVERALIERYFAAMRRGAAAEDELMDLFGDDSVYVEPFTGEEEPWVGKDAIRQALRKGWETPLPDLELTVERIEIRDGKAVADWVCTSPALPGPIEGRDRYTIVNGKIVRLEVAIRDEPT